MLVPVGRAPSSKRIVRHPADSYHALQCVYRFCCAVTRITEMPLGEALGPAQYHVFTDPLRYMCLQRDRYVLGRMPGCVCHAYSGKALHTLLGPSVLFNRL